VNQPAQQEPYSEIGQYLNEIVLEYYEILDHHLFAFGILKLGLSTLQPCSSLVCLDGDARELR
jgi:hypothetical protein